MSESSEMRTLALEGIAARAVTAWNRVEWEMKQSHWYQKESGFGITPFTELQNLYMAIYRRCI